MKVHIIIILLFIAELLKAQVSTVIDSSLFPKASNSINMDSSLIYPKELDSIENNAHQQKKIAYLNERIVNGKIPDVNYKLTTIDNRVFHKSDFTGKVIVFHYFCFWDSNFWAKKELPILNQVVNEFECEDILFFAFPAKDENKKKDYQEFFKSTPFYFNVVFDNAQAFFNLYGVEIFPHTIIFNKWGKIIAWTRGNKKEQLIYPIKKALKEKYVLKNPEKNEKK